MRLRLRVGVGLLNGIGLVDKGPLSGGQVEVVLSFARVVNDVVKLFAAIGKNAIDDAVIVDEINVPEHPEAVALDGSPRGPSPVLAVGEGGWDGLGASPAAGAGGRGLAVLGGAPGGGVDGDDLRGAGVAAGRGLRRG